MCTYKRVCNILIPAASLVMRGRLNLNSPGIKTPDPWDIEQTLVCEDEQIS